MAAALSKHEVQQGWLEMYLEGSLDDTTVWMLVVRSGASSSASMQREASRVRLKKLTEITRWTGQ